MRRTVCLLLALVPLLLLGCDSSNNDERIGHFQAEVEGAVTTRLDGSARFSIIENDDGTPSRFEIMLFAENGPSSELILRSADGSGRPQEAQYSVEQTFTGAPHVVRAEFKPDPFDAPAHIFEGEDGIVEITSVTETTIQGQFNFEALDGSAGERVFIGNGQFTAQRP